MAAVRPLLPALLARIALVYVIGGGGLGAVAGALAALWAPRRFWPVFAVELLGLWALLVWWHAIMRPALFDDVAIARGLLGVLVRSGEPWHVGVAAVVLAAAHGAALVWRLRERPGRLRAAAALGLLAAVSQPAPAKGQLTLLVGIDALRPDRLKVAPNLAAFVSDATLYTRAFTPIAQTEPAWRSMLTARWPNAAGSRYPLTAQARWPKLPVFPSELEQRGVATYFETDCSRFNFQDETSGFGHRRQPPRGAINFALEKLRFRGAGLLGDNALGAWLVPELVENRAIAGLYDPYGYAERLAARVVDAARAGPALYAFHATAAHFPGDPAWPFYRQAVRADAPLQRRLRMVFTPIASGTAGAAEWGREDSEALYDELIAQADLQLGLVLDAVKRAGLYDDAVIIVFSDHGESFHADTPALGGATPVHGARLDDEENHIFLAVKPGRAAHPATDDRLVRMIDIGPTVLGAPFGDGVPLGSTDGLKLYAETGFTHAAPNAFDPEHLALAPRTFDAYRVRPDGVVEMTDAAHDAVLREKDVGAFDGERWLVRSPLKDGTVRERCDGNCDALTKFLDEVTK
ncbi:MAG: sulfatase-like hydrolase/transferase [Myxococcaceae bacterium]|nr:sulfatase-like hydrolase/transferase [Myxococcaceae bacterium]